MAIGATNRSKLPGNDIHGSETRAPAGVGRDAGSRQQEAATVTDPGDSAPTSATLLMLHKPKGYVVTRSDERGRKTVYDLLPEWALRDGWMPVGRLDLDSRGLLLFALDGRVLDAVTRPGRILKTYEVWVRGRVTDEHVTQAQLYYEQAMEIHRTVGNRKFVAYAMINLGSVFQKQGKIKQAREHYEQSIPILRAIENNVDLVIALCSRGKIDLDTGNRSAATMALNEVTAIVRDTGAVPGSNIAKSLKEFRKKFDSTEASG